MAEVCTHACPSASACQGACIAQAQPQRREPDYAAERRLPAGLTCAACVHGSTCNALFGAVRRAFTSCDFWPSRFRQAVAPQSQEQT